jgi:ribosomal protein L32E
MTRNIHPHGFKTVVINNVSELNMLMMHGRTYATVAQEGGLFSSDAKSSLVPNSLLSA